MVKSRRGKGGTACVALSLGGLAEAAQISHSGAWQKPKARKCMPPSEEQVRGKKIQRKGDKACS